MTHIHIPWYCTSNTYGIVYELGRVYRYNHHRIRTLSNVPPRLTLFTLGRSSRKGVFMIGFEVEDGDICRITLGVTGNLVL